MVTKKIYLYNHVFIFVRNNISIKKYMLTKFSILYYDSKRKIKRNYFHLIFRRLLNKDMSKST